MRKSTPFVSDFCSHGVTHKQKAEGPTPTFIAGGRFTVRHHLFGQYFQIPGRIAIASFVPLLDMHMIIHVYARFNNFLYRQSFSRFVGRTKRKKPRVQPRLSMQEGVLACATSSSDSTFRSLAGSQLRASYPCWTRI